MKTTKEPLIGERLAKAAVNQILADRTCWKQSEWHSECGTKHCFGGWCQLLSGKEKNSNTTLSDASAALGITPTVANWIFAAERTVNDLYQFAATFSGWDRDGYNRDGWDRDGYNRDGWDRDGWDRDGWDRDGWDRDGYNRDGYNRAGKKLEPFSFE